MPLIRSREVTCAHRSCVRHCEDVLQPLDLRDGVLSVHSPSQYLILGRRGQTLPPNDLMPLGNDLMGLELCQEVYLVEKSWLCPSLFRFAKIAQTDTYKAEALLRTKLYSFSQL